MSRARISDRPPCFTEKEHAEWLEAAREVKARAGSRRRFQNVGVRPCQDCTTEYHRAMLAIDKCDGVPGRYSEMDELARRRYDAMVVLRRKRRRQAAKAS
jgi:hypothetical protein